MNDFFKKYGRNAAMDIAMVVVFLLISSCISKLPSRKGWSWEDTTPTRP